MLHLKRALYQGNSAKAATDAWQGEEILRRQILERGDVDAYGYSALIIHKLRYLARWPPHDLFEQIEDLFHLAQEGVRRFPLDNAMKEAYSEIAKAYLMTTVKGSSGPKSAATD